MDGEVADLWTGEQSIIDGHAATSGPGGGGSGIFSGPFAIRQNKNPSAAIGRNQGERGIDGVIQTGMIHAHIGGEAGELGALRRLLNDGIAPERNHAQLIARPHGFVQQADDFLFGIIGFGGHGFTAGGDDHDSSGAIGQADGELGEGENDGDQNDCPHNF